MVASHQDATPVAEPASGSGLALMVLVFLDGKVVSQVVAMTEGEERTVRPLLAKARPHLHRLAVVLRGGCGR